MAACFCLFLWYTQIFYSYNTTPHSAFNNQYSPSQALNADEETLEKIRKITRKYQAQRYVNRTNRLFRPEIPLEVGQTVRISYVAIPEKRKQSVLQQRGYKANATHPYI